MTQELSTTFEAELSEVALQPGTDDVFEIRVDEKTVWSHKAEARFPDTKETKQN